MRRLLVVIALLVAQPAAAAFSPPEKVGVAHAARACMAVANAERNLGASIRTGGDVAAQARAGAALVRAAGDVCSVFHGLVGGIRDRADGTPLTRDETLVEVWAHRGGALAESLETAVEALRGAGVDTYDLSLAAWHLNRIDGALPYADPAPQPLLPGQAVATVVGPHGDYFGAQRHLWLATHYFREWAVGWATVFEAMPGYRSAAFGDAFGTYALAIGLQVQAASLIASVPVGGNDTQQAQLDLKDRLCSVLKAGQWLWQAAPGGGVPEQYHAVMAAWSEIDPVDGLGKRGVRVARARAISAAYRRANVRLTDSWRHSHAADGDTAGDFKNEPQRSRCGQ